MAPPRCQEAAQRSHTIAAQSSRRCGHLMNAIASDGCKRVSHALAPLGGSCDSLGVSLDAAQHAC